MSRKPVGEPFGDSRDELMKVCMECWRIAGHCHPAPAMKWYENCEHLLDIGRDIRRKLAKSRSARGE